MNIKLAVASIIDIGTIGDTVDVAYKSQGDIVGIAEENLNTETLKHWCIKNLLKKHKAFTI